METGKEETRAAVVGIFWSPLWLKGKFFIRFASRIMSVDSGEPLTILRIKRKRGEEPVDALVLSDSKRRKKGLDVFQFVQTVEQEDSWNTKDIQVSLPLLHRCSIISTQPGTNLCARKNSTSGNQPADSLTQACKGSGHFKGLCYHQPISGYCETTAERASKGCLTQATEPCPRCPMLRRCSRERTRGDPG